MSYIDPDQLHGAMNDLNSAINDNSAALTAKGLAPAVLQTRLKTIQDDLSGKKGVRDKKKTELTNAQIDFASAAAGNYAEFSDLIDTVAGGVGKKTPEGDRVLNYRTHVTGGSHHAKTTPATAPAPAN